MTKILLVEDSKFLRLATERALVRAGYDVSSAADGEEALRVAQEKLPDLILLEMMLPKMSGPDVLKALKLNPETEKIPVVVLTGLSQIKCRPTAGGWGLRISGKIRALGGPGSGSLDLSVERDHQRSSANARTPGNRQHDVIGLSFLFRGNQVMVTSSRPRKGGLSFATPEQGLESAENK